MKTNVEKVLERDQKLSELDDRAGKVNSHFTLDFILIWVCQLNPVEPLYWPFLTFSNSPAPLIIVRFRAALHYEFGNAVATNLQNTDFKTLKPKRTIRKYSFLLNIIYYYYALAKLQIIFYFIYYFRNSAYATIMQS